MRLYEPPDLKEAYAAFSCNCGPAALAAVLRVPCMAVRPYFPLFPGRAYANPTNLQAALTAAGANWRKLPGAAWPAYGLCFLQVEGPWEDPGVPVTVAYRFTHWIAWAFVPVLGNHAYDVNAGRWLPAATWAAHVMAEVVAGVKRATGWRLRAAIDVATG